MAANLNDMTRLLAERNKTIRRLHEQERIASAAFAQVKAERDLAVAALKHVSFYASINHGTKCKDYGEVVDPVLKKLGVKTGEL